jgi:hypothetical protein
MVLCTSHYNNMATNVNAQLFGQLPRGQRKNRLGQTENERYSYLTATASGGAATLSNNCGTITSESVTTAAAAAYTLTLTNTTVLANSVVTVSVDNGTNSAGIPVVSTITPTAGQVVIKVYNLAASAAFNGTLKIRFLVQ